MDLQQPITIVGAGLAGSECALQLAEMGFEVHLYEMRNEVMTPAHKTGNFAELVCSNSLGSQSDYSAPGQLKWEAQALNCRLLQVALEMKVPAGQALAVDRGLFSAKITELIKCHPKIKIFNKVISALNDIPRPAVIATGPLTHEGLARDLQAHFGESFLYFYDAIAPIVDADTIDQHIAWKGDRYDKGTKDYYNCPLDKETYYRFIEEVLKAEKVALHDFENPHYFEGCMPIEAIAERGPETLRFGPMSPKGLRNPRNGCGSYAIVQLRQDNKEATAYNMVGFQTKMTYGEQTRIFRLIPGLENAEFLKLGSIHRNLYICSPKKLNRDLSSRQDPQLYFAGQMTGVEGYFESTSIGLLVAHFLKQKIRGQKFNPPPRATALGSLLESITAEDRAEDFQPTNINFGLFPPPPEQFRNKSDKKDRQLQIAKEQLEGWKRGLS